MSDRITISDSSQWPLQVSAISQYLTEELPPSLLSSDPTLSPRASQLWTEVTTRYPPSTSYQGLPHELVDVMDTLLSTVSIIRTLRDSNATSRETCPFVSLLLYALLRSCHQDAHVSENIRFARSYLDKLGNMTVGEARILASVVSPSSYDPDDDTISNGSASTESSSSVASAYEDSDDCSEHSRSTDGSTPCQSDSAESIPRNAHVYDFWPDRHSVAFPFVCVADEDSVVEILRSTVYQRATWALKDPVIGIALSAKDFIARVHFGWADQDPLEGAAIHITTSDHQASLGAFDLTAPDSALCLASFLLSLRPLYDIFAQQCHTALYNEVQWRADSFIDDMKRLPESWEETISAWLHHVQSNMTALETSEASPLSPLDSSGSCNNSPPVVCRPSLGSSRDTTSRGRKSRSPASSRSPAPTSVPAENVAQPDVEESIVPQVNIESERQEQKPSDKTGRVPTAVLNRCSPSKLCPPSEQELSSDDCLDIGSFLDDRNVIQIACVRLEDYVLQYAEEENTSLLDATHSTAPEVNSMVDLYNDLTEYRHLPNDFHAHIDPALFPLYELFKSPKKAFDDGAAGGKAICDAAALDLDLIPLICESLSLLLWNVGRAKSFKRSINTSGARQCWDFVIAMAFVSFGETVSRRVIMERKLPAARNAVADCVANEKDSSNTLHEANLNRARLCYELYQAAAILAPLLEDHTPEEWNVRTLTRSLSNAFSHSLTRHRNIKELQTVESSDIILKRAKEEINKSRCDSVAVFPAVGFKQPVLYPFVELAEDPVTTSLPCPAEHASSELAGRPLLPVFLGQYVKENETSSKAMHQSILHLVSAVVFLASLGFKKQPVYAVVTEGTDGVVLCCWHSAESDTIFLMDRNVRHFDISSPIQMYQFATFMMRLRKWSDRKLEQAVRDHVAMPEQDKWTKDARNDELFPEWKEMETKKEMRTKREHTV